MKLIKWINYIIVLLFSLFWLNDAHGYLEAHDSLFVFNDGEQIAVFGLAALACVAAYLIFSKHPNKLYHSSVLAIAVFVVVTFLIFDGRIYFYLSLQHNERFVIHEYILIYLSAFAAIWLAVNLVLFVVNRRKKKSEAK